MDFIGKPELITKNDSGKNFVCTQCGECCHIREKKTFTQAEESAYKDVMYRRFGIIYLADLSTITINILPAEKESLKKLAQNLGIKINILPKRALYDKKDNELIILDYFIDHDICPFFDAKNRLCKIHDKRPLICRAYPLVTSKTLGKCRYKKTDLTAYSNDEMNYAKILDKTVEEQKSAISQLIENGMISIEENFDVSSIDLKKVKIKELRLQ